MVERAHASLLRAYRGLKLFGEDAKTVNGRCLLRAYRGLKLVLIITLPEKLQRLLRAYRGLKPITFIWSRWLSFMFITCL